MLRKHSYVQAMENGLFEEWTALERERIEEEKQISLKVQPQTSTTIKIIRSNVEMIHSNNEEENRSEAVVLRPRTGNMEQVAGERRSIMEMFNLEQNGIGENEEYKDLLVKAEEEDKEILATKRLSSGIVPDELEPVTEDRDTNTNSITIPMIENSENSSSFHVVYTGRNSIRKSRRFVFKYYLILST